MPSLSFPGNFYQGLDYPTDLILKRKIRGGEAGMAVVAALALGTWGASSPCFTSSCLTRLRSSFKHPGVRTSIPAAAPWSSRFLIKSPFPPASLPSNRCKLRNVLTCKLKTHKASAKRFAVTGSGKIMRRKAGKQHLLQKKSSKRRNRLSHKTNVDKSDYANVIGALPYLKVVRKRRVMPTKIKAEEQSITVE